MDGADVEEAFRREPAPDAPDNLYFCEDLGEPADPGQLVRVDKPLTEGRVIALAFVGVISATGGWFLVDWLERAGRKEV